MKRRGSALLIVLGVLAFLVVSAVAFSAFMRRARLPSSYLRRSVAARELAKGALARAIDEIDRAIADDVHPGVGVRSSNKWRNRVFFGRDAEEDISQTAPTLTFEGLAYIPPPLVNEARYWSRKTPTAVWSSFGYDTGRYAYCALDVSDYFDVNRLVADYPRSSAANRRITAAHLFEPTGHRSAPSGADAWDTFMERFRDIDEDSLEITFDSNSKMPLVSVADFNLALGDKGSIGKMKSPFAEYIKTGTGSFYPAEGTAQLDMYSSMTFVTDGWFPKSKKTLSGNGNNAIETYDLADGRYQPYKMTDLQNGGPLVLSRTTALYKTQVAPSQEAKTWYDRLSGLGMTALADYLDADRPDFARRADDRARADDLRGRAAACAVPFVWRRANRHGSHWLGWRLAPAGQQPGHRAQDRAGCPLDSQARRLRPGVPGWTHPHDRRISVSPQ